MIGIGGRPFGKALSDLRYETRNLPEDVFETMTAERRVELLGEAVKRARAVFLRGEDHGNFFRSGENLTEDSGPYALPVEQADFLGPLIQRLVAQTKLDLSSPEGRTAALPVFEAAAEDFQALVPAFIRLVHAALPQAVARGFVGVPSLIIPPPPDEEDPLWLWTGMTASSVLGVREALAKNLPEDAASIAAKKVRRELLEAIGSWPRPEDVDAVFAAAEEQRSPENQGKPWRPGPSATVFVVSAAFVLGQYASRLREELVIREGIEWGRSTSLEARHVAIPSEASIPVLFTAGVPLAQRLTRFGVARVEDEDRHLDGVSFELKTVKDDSSRELTLFDPDVFEERIPRTELSLEAWRSEALALLPKVLGPEKLALYYATWNEPDAAGRFAFHPLPFLELFGMDPDDSRSRKKIEGEIRVLSRIELKIKRKYGPGAGTLASAESTFRLIEESSERLDLRFRDHPRLQRIVFFQHPKAMLDIRQKYHVNVPKEAFQLVGTWRPGRGSKDDGIRALALVTTAHVLARTYAGRSGKQAGATYFGPEGFEVPVEEIVLASGFTTAEDFAHNSKRVTGRLTETVARLAFEFRFLGPGSEVKDGRFRFEPTDALRKDLLPIAEKAAITPKRPSPAIEIPSRKKSRRGRRGV